MLAVNWMVWCGTQYSQNLRADQFASVWWIQKNGLFFLGELHPEGAGLIFSSPSPPSSFPNPSSATLWLCTVNPIRSEEISVRLFQGAAGTHKVGCCAIQHPGSSFSSHSQWQSFVRMHCWMLWAKSVGGSGVRFGLPFEGEEEKMCVLGKASAADGAVRAASSAPGCDAGVCEQEVGGEGCFVLAIRRPRLSVIIVSSTLGLVTSDAVIKAFGKHRCQLFIRSQVQPNCIKTRGRGRQRRAARCLEYLLSCCFWSPLIPGSLAERSGESVSCTLISIGVFSFALIHRGTVPFSNNRPFLMLMSRTVFQCLWKDYF